MVIARLCGSPEALRTTGLISAGLFVLSFALSRSY
jgi:hypothetical protein